MNAEKTAVSGTVGSSSRVITLILATVALLVAQIAVHIGVYWVRVQTFIVAPGRFRVWEWLVGSDIVLFACPLLMSAAAISLLWTLGRPGVQSKTLVISGLLALGAMYIAFLVAFNRWGT